MILTTESTVFISISKTLQKIEFIFMVFRMNEISIDDEIKEIIDETSKWTKLFESFWNVFSKNAQNCILFSQNARFSNT